MYLIKLDAIESTNDFLKHLHTQQTLPNYTVVWTAKQTKGKGQMGSVWETEPFKNLTFSVLIKEVIIPKEMLFDLNKIVSLAVLEVLQGLKIQDISVKWPNDILSGNQKLGGILIENQWKISGEVHAVVGIGLNVNQIKFEHLPHATSLKLLTNKEFDLQFLLELIVQKIKENYEKYALLKNELSNAYLKQLYKRNVPTVFENPSGHRFMGIIRDVLPNGKLWIELEKDQFQSFEIKEIKMLVR
jgi:BirA family biotin operon repressor/biotin-[acetyl-CoA-carboxylase] ligase